MNNLKEILEAVLFVAGDGIEKEDLLDKLEIFEEELDAAIEELENKYNGTSGINIITYKNKVQMCSNSDYADEVAAVLNPIRERKLSKATLEAMAIIAYKQPITRLGVENIRGVNSDYAIQNLIKHNLIEVVGRKDAVGKPMLFGTTDEFLKRFELKDLSDLPDYDELLKSIAVINDENKSTLYNEFDIDDNEEENVQVDEKLAEPLEKEDNLKVNDDLEENNSDKEYEVENDGIDDTLARLNALSEAVGN